MKARNGGEEGVTRGKCESAKWQKKCCKNPRACGGNAEACLCAMKMKARDGGGEGVTPLITAWPDGR